MAKKQMIKLIFSCITASLFLISTVAFSVTFSTNAESISPNPAIQYIVTDKAPLPLGHYSQATVYNGVVYVAGILGMNPHNENQRGSIEQQTEQALKNLQSVLLAANSDLQHLLTVTIYITDIKFAPKVNTIYSRVLGASKPARAMVTTPNLARGYEIEIVATAAVKAPIKTVK